MNCSNCGAPLDPDSTFCDQCGTTLGAGSGESIIIGADSSCDMVIDAPQVSGRHVKAEWCGVGKLRLTDLGSTNGLFVDGARVHEAEVAHGQHVSLGSHPLPIGDVFSRLITSPASVQPAPVDDYVEPGAPERPGVSPRTVYGPQAVRRSPGPSYRSAPPPGGGSSGLYIAVGLAGLVMVGVLVAVLVARPWEDGDGPGGGKQTQRAITPREGMETVERILNGRPELLGNVERYRQVLTKLEGVANAIDAIAPYVDEIDRFRGTSAWRTLSGFSTELQMVDSIVNTVSQVVSLSRNLAAAGQELPAAAAELTDAWGACKANPTQGTLRGVAQGAGGLTRPLERIHAPLQKLSASLNDVEDMVDEVTGVVAEFTDRAFVGGLASSLVSALNALSGKLGAATAAVNETKNDVGEDLAALNKVRQAIERFKFQ